MSRTEENFYEDSNILTLSDYSEERASVERINYNNSNDVIHKRLSIEKIQKNLEKAQQIYQAIEKYFKIINPSLQIQKQMISGVAMADSHYILPLIHVIQKNNQTLRNTIYNYDHKKSTASVHLFTEDFTSKTLQFDEQKNISLGPKSTGITLQKDQKEKYTTNKEQQINQGTQKIQHNRTNNKMTSIIDRCSKKKNDPSLERKNNISRDNSIQFTYNSKQKKQNRSLRKRQWLTMLQKNRKCQQKVNNIKNQLKQVKNQLNNINSTNNKQNKDRLKRHKLSEGCLNKMKQIISQDSKQIKNKVKFDLQNKQNRYSTNTVEKPKESQKILSNKQSQCELQSLLIQNQTLMDEFNKKSMKFAQFLSEFESQKQKNPLNNKSIKFQIPFVTKPEKKSKQIDNSMFKNIKNSNTYISVNKLQASSSPFQKSKLQEQLNNTFCSIKPIQIQRKQSSRLYIPITQLFNNMPITKSYTSLHAQQPVQNSQHRNSADRKISIFQSLKKSHIVPTIPLPQKITSLRPILSSTYIKQLQQQQRAISSEKKFNRRSYSGGSKRGISLISNRK